MIKNYLYSLTFLSFTIFQGAAKAQVISTIAGTFNGDGYRSTAIGITPAGQVVDTAGNMFIALPDRHVVLKLSAAGIYSTVAGNGAYGFKGDGGPGASAQLKNPWKVAVDTKGNVYIADNLDNRIRKVSPTGIITTIAGNGQSGFSGDGGQAIYARLQGPAGLAVDAAGNIFIADYVNRRVRKIATTGIITTVAGTGIAGNGGDNGPATAAQIGYISGIALNNAGELFIADNTNSKVRKVGTNGIITTVAGNGVQGFSGDGGLATAAMFSAINAVAVDKLGNLFIADSYNNRIRKVNASKIVSTVAGTGGGGFSGDGGLATSAQMYRPTSVAIDLAGNVLISGNFRVRKLTVSSGIITTVAGNGTGGYCGDGGPVTKAQLYHPVALTIDGSGNTFIVDRENHRIRKITTTGVITTVAGNGIAGFFGDGGLATSAQLNLPTSVAVDKAGNIYIADYQNNRIRKVASSTGIITTIAGLTGAGGFNGDGVASATRLWGPDGLTTDASGNVYFADQYNNRIRKITVATGLLNTVAGSGTKGFGGDGGSALLAALYWPNTVKLDKAGNVLIGDRRNNRVRKVSTLGIITTVAGNGNQPLSGDGGNAVLAGLDAASLAVDTLGNIFIADSYNERVRRVNKSGIITTLVSGIRTPTGIATDAAGNVFTAEYDNHRVLKINLAGVILSRSNTTQDITGLTTPIKFSVYPNPVQNVVYVQVPQSSEVSRVEVIDVAGKTLLSKKISLSQSLISMPLQKLAPGTYFVRTTSNNGSINVKEIIKN